MVSFTILLSFYIYQRKKLPRSNLYFLIAVSLGLIGIIGFTFDTLFNAFALQAGGETDVDRRAIIFSLNIYNICFTLFFILLYLHYSNRTNSKPSKWLLVTGMFFISIELLTFIFYSSNLFAYIVVPIL